jgi:2-alkenal reductase
MSDTPFWSPPPPPPAPPPPQARRGPNTAAVAAIALVLGAIGGGAAGGYVASTRLAPAAETTNVPAASAVPGTLPSAPPAAIPAGGASDVVAVVNELLPTVVTVINRLPNGQAQSSGSGFVIDSTRGYVVTNNHVIENVRDTNPGASFDVIFSDNRVVKDVKLVGRDDKTDVAVLQVPAQGLKAAALANSDDVPVGSTVVAIGSALGELQNTVTTGIVSAKGRRVPETDLIVLEDLIQTDAAINEGNSGGPLIWAVTKQVIGMNTLVNRQAGAEGLGFSISSNTVRAIANELISKGKIDRGAIGIAYNLLTPRAAAALSLPAQTQGIIISQVLAGSPAAQAGLKANDVITKINDQQIDGTHPIGSILLHTRPGDKVKLTIIRDGKQQTVDLTLGRQS